MLLISAAGGCFPRGLRQSSSSLTLLRCIGLHACPAGVTALRYNQLTQFLLQLTTLIIRLLQKIRKLPLHRIRIMGSQVAFRSTIFYSVQVKIKKIKRKYRSFAVNGKKKEQ